MADIDALIFSRDRPAQLELLLRSIDEHAPDLYASMSVLWTCSSPGFASGYRTVRELYPDVCFGRERDFEADVRDWFRHHAGETISFLVDDDVFYRDAPAPAALPWSYRGGDYWYPFSLDGNVYERSHVLRLLDDLSFRDPTELEATGHDHRSRLPFRSVHPCVPPCLVGVPANRVSTRSGMTHMGVDPAVLNERFCAGERLRIPEVNEPVGAHAPLPLVFA